MSLYAFVLFFHIAGVIALFITLSFEALSLFRMRRAQTLADVRLWLDPLPRLPLLTGISALVVLASGLHLAARMSAFREAWIDVTLVSLLLMAPLGAPAGKRLRAIRHAVADGTTLDPALRNHLQDGFLKISLCMRGSLFLGIVLLMIAKPELLQSICVVAAFLLLGLVLPLVFRGRTPQLSNSRTTTVNK
jgi:hypothetical protein